MGSCLYPVQSRFYLGPLLFFAFEYILLLSSVSSSKNMKHLIHEMIMILMFLFLLLKEITGLISGISLNPYSQ